MVTWTLSTLRNNSLMSSLQVAPSPNRSRDFAHEQLRLLTDHWPDPGSGDLQFVLVHTEALLQYTREAIRHERRNSSDAEQPLSVCGRQTVGLFRR